MKIIYLYLIVIEEAWISLWPCIRLHPPPPLKQDRNSRKASNGIRGNWWLFKKNSATSQWVSKPTIRYLYIAFHFIRNLKILKIIPHIFCLLHYKLWEKNRIKCPNKEKCLCTYIGFTDKNFSRLIEKNSLTYI